ncbi:remorin-like [Cynara cardunculus var. scolymus]|uniref:Remorin, C-terminal n=1 Tax=Cynara cardunculus var. scolymus TaxID=59895 RepID=A0A124SGR0_CYNCS|nr:remorin-like [Cynara cardunculus var. scolymus]KVI07171.1 Remorin, C-terminal [Cynara cardunculus var. scolymus]
MAAEEAQKVEVEPECPPEPPPAAAEVEEKAIVPLEPPPVPQENPVDDSKALVPVEKPTEPSKDKPAEGSVNRDAVLARVSTEKKDALIKAWEESEKSKAENKAQQKLSAIGAWENSKKADLEADLKKIEENLEKKKAKYIEKQKNKIALLHKQAEEKRAMTEAKRGEDLLKAEEVAAKCRATGTTPKIGWFS